jgi:hypothetical protein
LFADQPTDEVLGEFGRQALAASLADLDDPVELRELGMALYLDRPLGVTNQPGEFDRTPLVSYEAFSRSIAKRRIIALASAGWIDKERRETLLAAIAQLPICGVPLAQLSVVDRPGVVSIADAGKTASDFVFLRSTRGSLDALLATLDLGRLADRSPEVASWLLRATDVLLVHQVTLDRNQRPRLAVYRGHQLQVTLDLSGNPVE